MLPSGEWMCIFACWEWMVSYWVCFINRGVFCWCWSSEGNDVQSVQKLPLHGSEMWDFFGFLVQRGLTAENVASCMKTWSSTVGCGCNESCQAVVKIRASFFLSANRTNLFVNSLQTDGRITSLEMHGIQKRYSPEKHYVSGPCYWLTWFALFAFHQQFVDRWSGADPEICLRGPDPLLSLPLSSLSSLLCPYLFFPSLFSLLFLHSFPFSFSLFLSLCVIETG